MGLFGEKTACPVCGSPGGGLLAVKIKNGVALCKECSRKVRMDKSMLSLQTVDDIKKHLKYREENLKKFNSFSPSSEIKTNHVSVFRIDKNQKLWYASFKTDVNPPKAALVPRWSGEHYSAVLAQLSEEYMAKKAKRRLKASIFTFLSVTLMCNHLT